MTTYTTENPVATAYANSSLQNRDGVYFFVKSSLYNQGAGLALNDNDSVYYVNTGVLPIGLKTRIAVNTVVMET